MRRVLDSAEKRKVEGVGVSAEIGSVAAPASWGTARIGADSSEDGGGTKCCDLRIKRHYLLLACWSIVGFVSASLNLSRTWEG
jgi:hypothetical protein